MGGVLGGRLLSLIIIGEAVTKVMDRDPAFAARHSRIPWRNMRGMSNRITHGYFDINLDVVWETVQQALPELLPHLAAAQIARRRGLADQTLQHECSWPNYRCNEPGEQSCRKARQIKRMRRQPKG